MKKLYRLMLIAILLIVSAAVLPMPALACYSTGGALTGPVSISQSDIPKGAEVSVTITAGHGCVGADGDVIIEADGDKVFSSAFLAFNGSTHLSTYTLSEPASNLTVRIEVGFIAGPIAYKITISPGEGSGQPIPPDHRANWMMGDDIAAVYPETDAEGNPELHVYAIGDEGSGAYQFKVTLADLQPFIDNPPAENTLIKSSGKAALYALDSGEFQISLGPDDEGKYYDLIFTSLPVEAFKLIKWTISDVIGG
jgi:hypothetical protein